MILNIWVFWIESSTFLTKKYFCVFSQNGLTFEYISLSHVRKANISLSQSENIAVLPRKTISRLRSKYIASPQVTNFFHRPILRMMQNTNKKFRLEAKAIYRSYDPMRYVTRGATCKAPVHITKFSPHLLIYPAS